MVIFSNVFRKEVAKRAGKLTGTTVTKMVRQTSGNAEMGEKEPRSAFAELEKAASLYAAQLEKATRELGYNFKAYEEADAR